MPTASTAPAIISRFFTLNCLRIFLLLSILNYFFHFFYYIQFFIIAKLVRNAAGHSIKLTFPYIP